MRIFRIIITVIARMVVLTVKTVNSRVMKKTTGLLLLVHFVAIRKNCSDATCRTGLKNKMGKL